MKKSDLKKIILLGAAVTAAAGVTAIAVTQYRKHKAVMLENEHALNYKHAYITGGGLSALAAALYLVRDCKLLPQNVHLFTNRTFVRGNEITGYICRRGKIINEKSSLNLFDLLSEVSSLDIPDLTVCDEILNIYRANPDNRNITFIDEDKNVVDISDIRLSRSLRKSLLSLLQMKKEKLKLLAVEDALPYEFFDSYFYKLLRASYGFDENSSAYELLQCIQHLGDVLSGTMPDGFDRDETIIEPLKAHIQKIGIDVRDGAYVSDLDFEEGKVSAVHFTDKGIRKTFYLNDGDICIFPTDEMADCEAIGSFNESAPKVFSSPYKLWEKLARKNPNFKDPSAFFDEHDGDLAEEFTITLSNRLLPELIDKVTCGAFGYNGVIVLDNSNWKMTICAVPSTHFKNMSDDVAVIWGTAAQFDREGEFSEKSMTDCSGAEILYELISCLNLSDAWDDIRETVINVIPCHRKYDKSYLTPAASKLEIVPTGIENFAVSGDFSDNDGSEEVFSAEYSVATARRAAYKLMNSKKNVYSSKPNTGRCVNRILKKL
ncbi:MAG: hypothetical protein HFE50_02230 [Clostridia bacterium]|nr:hypothetical protein [Clostridia bacterium]